MNKKQFFRRNSHLNVDESEISRKWRVYQEEQEFLMMVEAERQGRGQVTIPSPGGGSGSLDQEVIYSLSLSFDDISSANILVGDSSNVVDWNTFFDLPTYGNPFTSVVIVGNGVQLFGGSDITIKENTFISNNSIIKVIDLGCVTSIYTDSFSYCENITEISFPECLDITGGEYFDAGAFYGLLSLTSMYFPKLIAIDNQCFSNCTSLTTIDLPNLTIAGENSFSNCSSLTTIDLPLLTTTAGETCFYNCTSLTTIDLPLLTTAGGDCFYNCTSLTTIDLPLLTTAGDGCFRNCTSLTTVDLPSLTTAGNNCFRDCTLPTTVNLPLLTTADGSCFAYCTSLTTVDLPLLTTAGETCFYSCTSLTTIDLPLLTTTGDSCFQDCTALTTISLPLLTMTGNYCFGNCASLTTISLPECTNLGSTVGDNDVFANITGQTITLTVPLSLMTCNGGNPDGDIQFLQANNTVTIVISDPALRLTFDSITNADLLVGDSADVTDWNTFFDLPTYGNPFTGVDIAGNEVSLFGGSEIILKDNLFANNVNLITIDDSLGCIINAGHACLSGNTSLTTINLPALTTGDDFCFLSCYSLTTINLPQLTIMGEGFFSECNSLTTINLPVLTTLGNFCFSNCSLLTTISLPACYNLGTTVGNNNVFDYINGNIITLTVPSAMMTCNSGNPDGDIQYLQANNTVTIIEITSSLKLTFDDIANANALVGDASSVTDWNTFFDLPTYGNPFTNVEVSGNTVSLFGGSNITVVPGAEDYHQTPINFAGNQHIISIDDEDGYIIEIGYSSFFQCHNLTTAKFKNVISIGDYAFQDDYSLVTVDFSSLVTAGNACFTYYTENACAFVNPSFPSLTTVGYECFAFCYSLISIESPNLTTVGVGCFQNCASLTTIDLPNLNIVGNDCFARCTSLTTISLPSCIDLGDTIGNNNVFLNIIGKTITLTVPAALMTCNGGNPDGDIQYLQANNTVTIIEIQPSLNLTFDSITNADLLVGDSADVTDWNTFFDLPINGNEFTSVVVNGNEVSLIGGSNIIIRDGLFYYGTVGQILTGFEDTGSVIEVGPDSFMYQNLLTTFTSYTITTVREYGLDGLESLTTLELPNLVTTDDAAFINEFGGVYVLNTLSLPNLVITMGDYNFYSTTGVLNYSFPLLENVGIEAFAYCSTMETLYIPSMLNLGPTTGLDGVFTNIIGQDITLTIPSSLMICNGGLPDGDIQYLQANNTVTIIEIPTSLNLTFDNITNVPVVDASSVTDWNTFFDLPTYGNPFTSVEVSGNTVSLFGGSNIDLKDSLFVISGQGPALQQINDNAGCIISAGYNVFGDEEDIGCPNLTTVYLPELLSAGGSCFISTRNLINVSMDKVISIGSYCFNGSNLLSTISLPVVQSIGDGAFGSTILTTISIPSCINLGSTVGYNDVFNNITGQTIILTVPSALMTCNGGLPDGDIQYLQANNTVTIIEIPASLNLTFDNITNVPVADASSVTDWNTFFDLPTYGNPFTSVEVSGNEVNLIGGSEIILIDGLFVYYDHLIKVEDSGSVITIMGTFEECGGLTEVSFNGCTQVFLGDADYGSFGYSTVVTANFPVCTYMETGFYGSNLVSIFAPLLEEAGNDCFASCNLTTIDLPSLITAGNSCFNSCDSLTTISLPSLITAGSSCFNYCDLLTTINLPVVQSIGYGAFASTILTTINLSSCTDLGGTVGDDGVFDSIIGNTITLTIPAALMICNGGNPDGDIQYLQANNTVTIIEIPTSLNLTFDNITNVPVADANSVSDWNTFFDLPTYGNPFTNVEVIGNEVNLIGGSNITLKYLLFEGNQHLLKVIDNSSIVKLRDACFDSCYNLTNVYLPEVLETTSEGGFYGPFGYCENLIEAYLPKLTIIASLFYDCFNLTDSGLTLPFDEILSIGTSENIFGNGVIEGCNSLTELNFPNAINTIELSFINCIGLITINLPNLITLGNGSFGACRSLSVINLSSCINLGTTVGNNYIFEAIEGNTITLTVPSALMTCNGGLPDGDIQYLQANNTVTIVISDSALRLTFDSIANADLLVGDSADVTDWNTFFDLPTYGNPFTSVQVVGNEVNLIGGSNITIKDYLFYDFNNDIGCPYIISIEDEGAVVTIGGDAFASCYLLTSVSFLECTTIVGYGDTLYYGSFGECVNLVTINFPKLIYAGDYSFWNTSLINCNLPLLEVTEYGVFQNCSSLIFIDLPSLTTLGGQSFSQCAELVSVNIPLITTINAYAFRYCRKLTTITAPIVTVIHDGAFNYCELLVSVNFPLLVSIDDYVFQNCVSLTSINFPLLTYAGFYSFSNCYSLTEVNLPLVTDIEGSVFYSCSLLNIVNVPSVINVGDQCFGFCTSLTNISLPLVTNIKGLTFRNCTSLTIINLPSVTQMGNDCVYNSDIFYNIIGNTIQLTIPAIPLMSCAVGGLPNPNIQYLQANNTVTIITT